MMTIFYIIKGDKIFFDQSAYIAKTMLSFAVLLFLTLILFTCPATAAVTEQEAANLSEELSKKIESLGDFNAIYKAVSGEKILMLHVTRSIKHNYLLLQMPVMPEPTGLDAMLFTREDGKGVTSLLSSSSKQVYYFVTADAVNPDTFLLASLPLIAEALTSAMTPKDIKTLLATDTTFAYPAMDMELLEQDISISIGAKESSTGQMSVSWLTLDRLEGAISIDNRDKHTVKLSYPGNHTVTIDRASGMLSEVSRPSITKGTARTITLSEFKNLKNAPPLGSLMNDYESYTKIPMDPKEIAAVFIAPYMLATIRNIESIPDYKTLAKKHQQALAEIIRETSTRYWRATIAANGAMPPFADKYLNEFLDPFYETLKSEGKVAGKSFDQWLKDINSSDLLAPMKSAVGEDLIGINSQSLRGHLSLIPPEAQETALWIVQENLLPYMEGLLTAYIESLIKYALDISPK